MDLPFREEFKDRLLSGQKTCTSRTRKYADKGDKFKVFGEYFEITNIVHYSLGFVARNLFEEEGFNSPQEFINCWVKLHPHKKWVEEQGVVVHFFKKSRLK